MNHSELAHNRRQTKQYISHDPTDLVLTRSETVSDGAGGVIKQGPTDLSPQTVRLIHKPSGSAAVERRTVDGEVVRPNATLMAEHDADIKEGDQFTWEDRSWEVVFIMNLDYELLCEVATR